ncbi:GSCOCG00003021001-RA-CDS [Cotesia congregata]|nr:GSCOCG00003021001-RA-CDS [Cotesia congregata]
MKICVFFGAMLLALSIPSSLPAAVESNQSNQVDQLATQRVVYMMNLVSNAMYNAATAENHSNNVILASLNLLLPLAELFYSTNADFKNNINASYQFTFDIDLSKQFIHKIILNLYYAQSDKVRFFNNLYYQQGLTLKQNFLDIAKDDFKSIEPQSVDFNALQFVEEFNQFIYNHTNGFINNFLQHDDVKNAGLVQQYIGYSDLEFENKFNLLPELGVFKNKDNFEESAQFLILNETLKHGSLNNSKASWVEIPLKNKAFSLYFVAFGDQDNFESFEKNIGRFDPLNHPYNDSPLSVKLPVFNINSSLDMTEIIKEAKLGEVYNNVGGVFVNSTLTTDKIFEIASAKLSDISLQLSTVSTVINGMVAHESNPSQNQVDRSQFLNSTSFKSSADDTQTEIVFDKPFIILLFDAKTRVQALYASVNNMNGPKLNNNSGSSN